ncbi:MAG: hypothetical protein GXY14_00105, partial [Spirochaetes bacterium]|nr:hypothetical protein [Spirochaetota bacterium]
MAKYSGKTFVNPGGADKDQLKSPGKLKLNIKKFKPGKNLSSIPVKIQTALKFSRDRLAGFIPWKNKPSGSPSSSSFKTVTRRNSFSTPSPGKTSIGTFPGISSGGRSISSKSFNIPSGRIGNILSGIIDMTKGAFTNFPQFFRNYKTIILGVGAGFILAFIIILVIDFGRVKALATYQPDVTTRIYDKNNILIGEIFSEKREVVPYDRIPQHLMNAFI